MHLSKFSFVPGSRGEYFKVSCDTCWEPAIKLDSGYGPELSLCVKHWKQLVESLEFKFYEDEGFISMGDGIYKPVKLPVHICESPRNLDFQFSSQRDCLTATAGGITYEITEDVSILVSLPDAKVQFGPFNSINEAMDAAEAHYEKQSE